MVIRFTLNEEIVGTVHGSSPYMALSSSRVIGRYTLNIETQEAQTASVTKSRRKSSRLSLYKKILVQSQSPCKEYLKFFFTLLYIFFIRPRNFIAFLNFKILFLCGIKVVKLLFSSILKFHKIPNLKIKNNLTFIRLYSII